MLAPNARHLLLGAALMLTAIACDDSFDPSSEIRGVRVMAVQKTPVFARPGETVDLTMLWADAPRDEPREIQRAWYGGCHNPDGDLFTGCVDQLSSPDPEDLGIGDQYALTIPDDIISSRPPPSDGVQPPYGLSFVFFAACAGQLTPVTDGSAEGIPLSCRDGQGRELGADDFVVGYTQILSYEELSNANPPLSGVRIEGREVPLDCQDDACVAELETSAIDCGDDPRCISACGDDADEDVCPEIKIEPMFSGEVAQVDPVATEADGVTTYEQSWVNYFVDRGAVGADTRIVVDSDTGLRDDFSSELFAPSRTGEMRVWVSVHDSRGGASWARLRLRVR